MISVIWLIVDVDNQLVIWLIMLIIIISIILHSIINNHYMIQLIFVDCWYLRLSHFTLSRAPQGSSHGPGNWWKNCDRSSVPCHAEDGRSHGKRLWYIKYLKSNAYIMNNIWFLYMFLWYKDMIFIRYDIFIIILYIHIYIYIYTYIHIYIYTYIFIYIICINVIIWQCVCMRCESNEVMNRLHPCRC